MSVPFTITQQQLMFFLNKYLYIIVLFVVFYSVHKNCIHHWIEDSNKSCKLAVFRGITHIQPGILKLDGLPR